MKDKNKIWHIIGTVITVSFSLYGVITSVIDKDKNEKARQTQQCQMEQKMKQREEEAALSKDPAFQVTSSYNEFRKYKMRGELDRFDKIQLNKAMNQLREWIPKYRYVLLEKKEKALLEGNSSTVEYCETELYRLKDIENEVLN